MPAQVNGDAHPASATLSHISEYPVVNDSLSYLKKNPYGQKSIELSDSAYQTFAKPIMPYLARPYQYVSPYVQKADYIGDNALGRFDQRLPILTKSTDELLDYGQNIIFFPLRKSMQTKDHLFDVYASERKKFNGEGLVTYGKAWVSTGLVATSEVLTWIGDMIRASKQQAKQFGNEAAEQAKETGSEAAEQAKQSGNQASEKTKETGNQASEKAKQTGNQAREKTKEAGDKAKN
ncbi:Uu.00g070450.m01.CDS01 [Anthostomella pinea]|uniref:Uu.00g070450.m01.CDS01 n=1 Tax=Anthostomella pinea TaxID=933095 RepID=A0AAI8YNQ0_9PEZI|nr:Uu.00g070450.m01.CDS01 [Anthostomella pinea]